MAAADVVPQLFHGDLAGGQDLEHGEGIGHLFDPGNAPCGFRREELEHVQAVPGGHLVFRGGHSAGIIGQALGQAVIHQLRIKTGRDQKFRSGLHGDIHLGGIYYGAGPYGHFGAGLLHDLNGALRPCRAEGDLCQRNASLAQGSCQRSRVPFGVVQFDHRHHACLEEHFVDFLSHLQLLHFRERSVLRFFPGPCGSA